MDDLRDLVALECAGADLGDKRLNKRLVTSSRAVAADPSKGFPQLMSEAELEGFYRFLSNDDVDAATILAPHRGATVERCAAHGVVVCVQDTSAFVFGTPREGLGDDRKNTFRAHATLAVTANEAREPLGVLDLHTWARTGESASKKRLSGQVSYEESRKLPREQERWASSVARSTAVVGQAAQLIHVMDSEADDYTLLAGLVHEGHRFVIRLCSDRLLARDTREEPRKLREQVKTFPALYEQEVELGERRNSTRYPPRTKRSLPRASRTAQLTVHAGTAHVRAPGHLGSDCVKSVVLGIVWVREHEPPDGQQPIDWILATTEPLRTPAEVRSVVTYYRCRWVIEEFFKALKSGCSFERRQLETYESIVNALAMFTPVAWGLLRLRSLSRAAKPRPAAGVLTETQIQVLSLLSPPFAEINAPSARDALLAIAKLGGHLKRNGDPGWQVLGRGYAKLLEICQGFLLARSQM
jgi:hypothetical protein